LQRELAHKIASFIGPREKLITDVPGLLLTRRTAPTAPASATYEPSLAVVAQGRKQATLGATTFIFDESQYLLTSLDLPVICNVIEASEAVPYLCFVLKLEMPVVQSFSAGRRFKRLRRRRAVLPCPPVRPRRSCSMHAVGSWTC
jgi:hypothetical protein